MVLTSFVGYGTATGTQGATNECALATAHQTADYSAAHGRAANHLGARVVPMIASPLLCLDPLMLPFGNRLSKDRKRQEGTQCRCRYKTFHLGGHLHGSLPHQVRCTLRL